MIQGIDVSVFQNPALPGGYTWSNLANAGCQFAIVRGSYGTEKDARSVAHVQAARGVKMHVGLYHFFRSIQNPHPQFEAFCEAAYDCGFGAGDILPAVDIEQDGPKGEPVNPQWCDPLEYVIESLASAFGGCLIYLSQAGFAQLGKPSFVLKHQLWVPYWVDSKAPALPVGATSCAIWQKRVGPWQLGGKGGFFGNVLDQDFVDGDLPLCTRSYWGPEHSADELNQVRWDALTQHLADNLDLTHGESDYAPTRDTDASELGAEHEHETVPDNPKPEA